ncbi:histidine kinase N-terminal domain-containing protein [Bacillus salitolerans]|uniref:histidine kinase n=1 Tax=Bacillus salitolerans TaxID=1437434 RepID=A0ABW4LN55_9BACI
MSTVEEKLCLYLENNYEDFIDKWSKIVIISSDDPYKDEVRHNGRKMIQLVINFLRHEYNRDLLKELADKVAIERFGAKVNIGEFIYNVNIGRSEIFKHLNDSQIPLEMLQPTINKINSCFDQFIYFAVLKYTELKDKDLEEKNTLIEHTHKDRLTILGQMASSFVHEFRNPLTSITGFIKLLQQENKDLKYLDIISHELEQLNYRITQFLLVSKKEMIGSSKNTFSLPSLCDEVKQFLYPSLVASNVQVDLHIDPTVQLFGYREEIRQVILNIVINSIDALESVKEERHVLISAEIIAHRQSVSIKIQNNGPMIPEEYLQSIFEPFVTNKKLGTGIGLFVCKQIIEKHGGSISCKSCNEHTTFVIELPLLIDAPTSDRQFESRMN